ncbi:MAG TPA: nucleotidyltransferase domain-containing protein [Chloroflexi bacterium]|nr:nucleotidyltransferase domain-containing protein [Chloroflexota bacterium]
MVDPADFQAASEVKRRFDKIVSVLDMRLFGSRARGDAAPDSDLDLFVEVEETTPELLLRMDEIACDVGFEQNYVIVPIVVTRREIQSGPLGASPLILNIEREGVPI